MANWDEIDKLIAERDAAVDGVAQKIGEAFEDFRSRADAAAAQAHPDDKLDRLRGDLFSNILRALTQAVKAHLGGALYSTDGNVPPGSQSALDSAVGLLFIAENLAARPKLSDWQPPWSPSDYLPKMYEQLHKIQAILHADGRTRGETQIEALRSIERHANRGEPRLQKSWEAGNRFPGLEKIENFDDYFGAALAHDIGTLRPVTVLQERAEGIERAYPEMFEPSIWALAREAVRSWHRVGRPRKGQRSKFESANRLLTALGLGAASARALEHTWVTRKRKALDRE